MPKGSAGSVHKAPAGKSNPPKSTRTGSWGKPPQNPQPTRTVQPLEVCEVLELGRQRHPQLGLSGTSPGFGGTKASERLSFLGC
jgi:hypothetical protein